jgi:putative FmdB family regulatory protein
MPIYEYACPECRRIYSFLARRVRSRKVPKCPRCGSRNLTRQLSSFAAPRGAAEPADGSVEGSGSPVPDLDDPKLSRAMGEFEREMSRLDSNDPRQVARLIRRMKDALPRGAMPKEMDAALKRLEAGESPERIEEDMGDVLDKFLDAADGDEKTSRDRGGPKDFARDPGLYDL